MNDNAAIFQRRKLAVTLGIMGGGMLLALIWHFYQGAVLGAGYPYNTFLFLPTARFSDYSDTLSMAMLPNPYLEPDIPYLPFSWIVLRPLALLPCVVSIILVYFISLAVLAIVLDKVLDSVVVNPWLRVCSSYLLMGLSFPLLLCIDRGNIEIVMATLIATAVYFFSRGKYVNGTLWLFPAICMKLYPALLLVLLVRQRKLLLAASAVVLFVAVTLLSLNILSLSYETTWALYLRNAHYYSDIYVYENHALEGSASLWNCYKVGLISAAYMQLIPPVDFSFDANFIRTSYAIYSTGMALLAATLVIYVCLVEKEFLRCAAVLLLFMTISAPSGADYRLLYSGMALVSLIILRTNRPHDWLVVIPLALTMVPKKEILLTFAGRTESNAADVSIQVLLNPLCVGAAIALLLYDAWRVSDLKWSAQRLFGLRNSAFGWLRLHN